MYQAVRTVRKHQRKSELDDNKTLMDIGARASRTAVQQALDAGVSITFVENASRVVFSLTTKSFRFKPIWISSNFVLFCVYDSSLIHQ